MNPVVAFQFLAEAGMFPPGNSGFSDDPVAGLLAFVLALIFIGVAVDLALLFYFVAHPIRTSDHSAVLKSRPIAWIPSLRILAMLLFLFSLVGLTQWCILKFGDNPADHVATWLMVQSITFHWTGLALIALMLKQQRSRWSKAFGFRSSFVLRDLLLGLFFYLGTLPAVWFYALLYQAGLHFAGYEPTLQDAALVIAGIRTPWIRIYALFLTIILAPAVEEMIFRGMVFPLFAKKWGVAAATILVSLLFGIIHLEVTPFVPLFVLSVACCLAYLYTESILVPMIMHGLFNGVSLYLMMKLMG